MQGPRLAWALSTVCFLLSVGILLLYGINGDGLRQGVVATARVSALFFLMAFLARPLHQLWQSEISGWMLKNRRYIGISAAFMHFLHFIAVIWLLNVFPPDDYVADLTTLIFGGFGFAVYFAMGLTSSDAAVAHLGRQNWRRLHRFGVWYVWFIFAQTYMGGAVIEGSFVASSMAAAFVGAAGLRAMLHLRKRKAAFQGS